MKTVCERCESQRATKWIGTKSLSMLPQKVCKQCYSELAVIGERVINVNREPVLAKGR